LHKIRGHFWVSHFRVNKGYTQSVLGR
jgi:hypothetical protein